MLALILGWLNVFSSVGLKISRAEIRGKYRDLLSSFLMGSTTHKDVIELWRNNNTPNVETSTGRLWMVERSEQVYEIARPDCGSNSRIVSFDNLDSDNWLSLVAENYIAGYELVLSALTKKQKTKRLRLPGPVLIGKRYWPEQFQWY